MHFAESTDHTGAAAEPVAQVTPDVIRLVAQHLDVDYYKAKQPAFDETGLNPAEHYCAVGWREGLDPAPDFSTSYYLTTNPDIKASGVNPFWHYLIAGRGEGRLPTHPGGWRHGVISGLTNFEALCADWKRPERAPECLAADEIGERLSDGRGCRRLMISIGHDDYRASPGGVQLCIEMEADLAPSKGVDYLNMHPWQPLPETGGRGFGAGHGDGAERENPGHGEDVPRSFARWPSRGCAPRASNWSFITFRGMCRRTS